MSIDSTINDTSITKFEKNERINKVFGNSIKNSFKSFDFSSKNESDLIGCSVSNNGYEKFWLQSQEGNIYKQKR